MFNLGWISQWKAQNKRAARDPVGHISITCANRFALRGGGVLETVRGPCAYSAKHWPACGKEMPIPPSTLSRQTVAKSPRRSGVV